MVVSKAISEATVDGLPQGRLVLFGANRRVHLRPRAQALVHFRCVKSQMLGRISNVTNSRAKEEIGISPAVVTCNTCNLRFVFSAKLMMLRVEMTAHSSFSPLRVRFNTLAFEHGLAFFQAFSSSLCTATRREPDFMTCR